MISYRAMRVQRLSKEYLEDLGLRIKLARTYMKLEQKEFAAKLKTAQSQVSKIESGKTCPTIYHLLTIKKLADQNENINGNLSWSWLLEGKGNIFTSQ